jgi:hypothetical protein
MNAQFEIPDPQGARDYLLKFSQPARQAGRRLTIMGLVEPARLETGRRFLAEVRDGDLVTVELVHNEKLGWDIGCSCLEVSWCAHAYAALRELISRSTHTAPVFGRPEIQIQASPKLAIEALLGRDLRNSEAQVLRRIELHFPSVRLVGRVSAWDLGVMGLDPGRKSSFGVVELPWTPRDTFEFLRLVLWLMEERQVPIPPFLRPLARSEDFAARMDEVQRLHRVQQWKSVWRTVSAQDVTSATTEPVPVRFRLRFTAQGAICEWVPPNRDGFQALKKRDLQDLVDRFGAGQIVLTPGNALLWSVLEPRQLQGPSLTLSYSSPADAAQIRRLLLQPEAAAHLVTMDGRELTRSSESLRWQMTPPDESRPGTYRLQVVHHDGRPVSRMIGLLRGQPTHYLTTDAVHSGPFLPQDTVDWLSEQEIPAEAIECPEGIISLHRMGVPLPNRLERQIQFQTVRVKIACQLEKPRYRSSDENCVFRVTARSKDKVVRETWTLAGGWTSETSPWHSKPPALVTRPVIYDRTLQERAAALLGSLNLRQDYNARPMLKLTKSFPQSFLDWLRSVPPEIEVQLDDELASLARDPLAGRVRLEAEEASIDWFDLRVVVDVADSELTPEELQLLLASPGQPVRLPKKGWRRLAFDLSEQEDQQLARLGLSPHELTDEPQRLHALQLADESARGLLPAEQTDRIQRRASEIRARVTPSHPEGVQATMRPYQTDGFHFLAYLATNHFGGILADDMGLGKTLQALVWISWLHQQVGRSEVAHASTAVDGSSAHPAAPPTLVVCPKSVMDNWRAEVERFTPGLRVKVWSSSTVSNLSNQIDTADIHVIHYTQLRLAEDQLTPVRWLAVILDEGQFIKNPDSQTAQAARRLRSEHRLVLSGTPIENRLLDLWSLLSFAMPGVLGNRAAFQRIYDAKNDPLARQRLAARVRPFLLRRTKGQVAKDLPDRIEEDLYCEMEGVQRTLYQAELKRARQMLLKVNTKADLAAHQFHFLTSLLRLRQICCHPALVQSTQAGESAKFNALLEQLEPLMAEGHKVLVFSQFVGLLELLQPQLKARDWPVFLLTGATENRADKVRDFQTAEGGAIFLLSLKAGGFGLNLTAASYVMLFDPWWNPAVENQAIDRTHRIGQTRTVFAYRLLIKDSIEEKVRLLQKQKSALAEDILGEERFAQALTLDDLHFLFSD